MAHFVSKPTQGIDPVSEINVAKALEQLNDDWHIIHSIAWQGIRGKREGDGEADFVLISKNVGIVVLEVTSPFYVFADSDQKLWARNWEPRRDWLIYELTINCRNTQEIAMKVANVLAQKVELLGAQGPEPKWSVLSPKADIPDFVCNVIADLLDDGMEARDIVVLCQDARQAGTIAQMTAGSASCCSYGGNGVVVETIARFKGLEAAAIILVLNEAQNSPDVMAYVGFSRARSYLHVIGPNTRQKTSNWTNS